jgi:hypothetical protein
MTANQRQPERRKTLARRGPSTHDITPAAEKSSSMRSTDDLDGALLLTLADRGFYDRLSER